MGQIDQKLIPQGIKLIFIFIVFLSVSCFFVMMTHEFMKATYYARTFSPEKRYRIIERAQQRGHPITSIDNFDAMGKAEAWPRVKAQIPLLTIHALILWTLAWGLLNFKNWARVGLLIYSIYTIVFNAWFIKDYPYPWSVSYYDVGHRIFMILGSMITLVYLARSKVRVYFR